MDGNPNSFNREPQAIAHGAVTPHITVNVRLAVACGSPSNELPETFASDSAVFSLQPGTQAAHNHADSHIRHPRSCSKIFTGF
jgi:hypothetical protein